MPRKKKSEEIEELVAAVEELSAEEAGAFPSAPALSPEIQAKKLAAKTAPPSKPLLSNGPSKVTMKTFLGVSGMRPDQRAGFIRHAMGEGIYHKRFTLDEWKSFLESFLNRPMVR